MSSRGSAQITYGYIEATKEVICYANVITYYFFSDSEANFSAWSSNSAKWSFPTTEQGSNNRGDIGEKSAALERVIQFYSTVTVLQYFYSVTMTYDICLRHSNRPEMQSSNKTLNTLPER